MKWVKDGNKEQAVTEVKRLMDRGETAEHIITQYIEPAMDSLSNKCTAENFNLLEVMLSGRAVMSVMQTLFPPGTEPAPTKGLVVIATLEGDVHDIGKNILKTILTINGYHVIDCGKDCPIEQLIDTVKKEKPFAIGVSGLISSVVPLVKKIKPLLQENKLPNIKVCAGGAALKQASKELLNVDFLAENAFAGQSYLDAVWTREQT
ncbi:cobalamin B12-binding domain-containing protein [Desulfobacter latus]|nr:cobalamin-dependent protein [Desulfobacter latus]